MPLDEKLEEGYDGSARGMRRCTVREMQELGS